MSRSILSRVIFVAAIAFVLSGCGSSRTAVAPVSSDDLLSESLPLPQRYDRLAASYRDWTDVSVPVNLALTQPQKFSISGRAKMIRGESVDISLRMLGFEVGRLLLTTDSVHVVVKPQKVYLSESLSQLSPEMPVTISDLQDMLMGRVFLLKQGTADVSMAKSFDLSEADGMWLAVPRKQPRGVKYGFSVTLDDVLAMLGAGSDAGTFEATAQYSDPLSTDGAGTVAGNVDINVKTGRKNVAATFGWRWRDARWNQGVEIEWQQPRGYTRLKGTDVLNKLIPKK